MSIRLVSFLATVALLSPVLAFASTSITGYTINGGATATVEPSDPVSVEIFVTTTGGDDWESTSADWISDGNPSTCFNTTDRTSSGSYSATFNFTAPSVDGIYDLNLGAHGLNGGSDDDTCSVSADDTSLAADVLTVETPPAPVDTDGDGVEDSSDNCPADANAGQEDNDTDGEGNACDATPDGAPSPSPADDDIPSVTGGSIALCSWALINGKLGEVACINDLEGGIKYQATLENFVTFLQQYINWRLHGVIPLWL